MSVTALHPSAIAAVSGRAISGALGPTSVVMGERTAGLRGAQAGDLIDLVAADGGVHTLTISRIGTEDEVGGTELLMTTAAAGRLGDHHRHPGRDLRVPSRVALDAALADRGREQSLPDPGAPQLGSAQPRRQPRARPHQGAARRVRLPDPRRRQHRPGGGVAGGEPAGRSRAPRARRSRSGRAATTGSSPTSRRRSTMWPRPVSPAPST